MGVKSRNRAEKRKEEKKNLYYAKLNNCPTSPRKMRLVADMIRGKKVEQALVMLKNSPQVSSGRIVYPVEVGNCKLAGQERRCQDRRKRPFCKRDLRGQRQGAKTHPHCPPGTCSPDQETFKSCDTDRRQPNNPECS